jgi:hypothetical protein
MQNLTLSQADLLQLKEKGISELKLKEQLNAFVKGFPFLSVVSSASVDKGILQLSHEDISEYLRIWDLYLEKNHTIVKFVPASGAASRMFKDLYEFLDGESEIPQKESVIEFFEQIDKFAFYNLLDGTCEANEGSDIAGLIVAEKYKSVVDNLLNAKGLNYGSLPKGLLLFHRYEQGNRTPFMEHLAEGAFYARNKQGVVRIHFTVSGDHQPLFEKHFKDVVDDFSAVFHADYLISFSEQKPSTDTIAADENNQPFREGGKLLFRPGGHGALIENLNDLEADVIFIKNIDNVVPDALKNPTIIYKKMIAGLLVKIQEQTFEYLRMMDKGQLPEHQLQEISTFCEETLNNLHSNISSLSGRALQDYLKRKLNRPIRVCGMVLNTGEPGGGPFFTKNEDGTVSAQILESSQINTNNPEERSKMAQSTHFNPVDLVCGVRNYKGEKFNLTQYVDQDTGFISLKSKSGKTLKALELPGLWNGAMSDWNTIFVEVPITTFNPVKTVNDLLRIVHQ